MTEAFDRRRQRAYERDQQLNGPHAEEGEFLVFDSFITRAAENQSDVYRDGFLTEAAGVRAKILQPWRRKRIGTLLDVGLNAHGETRRLEELREATVAEINSKRADVTKHIGADVEKRRAAALAKLQRTEDPTLRYLRGRDIREHIRTLDLSVQDTQGRPAALMQALEGAIKRGHGGAWLDALEDPVVPIAVDPAIVTTLRQQIIDGTDPELAALANLERDYHLALNFAERIVLDTVKIDGMPIEPPAPTPDTRQPVLLSTGKPPGSDAA